MSLCTRLALFALCLFAVSAVLGRSAFTYQGKLTQDGLPANGVYDFRFTVWRSTVVMTIGHPVEVGDVTVANGAFTVTIDIGTTITDTDAQLEVAVRPGISTGEYTVLSPRQDLTSTPYANFAYKAASAQDAWSMSGNTLGGSRFLGTINDCWLQFKVNNVHALRIEPSYEGDRTYPPNIIGGARENSITPSAFAAVICGGGDKDHPNAITKAWSTICGGNNNTVDAYLSTILGGTSNTITGNYSIAGGDSNTVSGNYSLALGTRNTSSGVSSFALGTETTADARDAFALGRRAKTNGKSGTLVWADGTSADFLATAQNEFAARAMGGVRFVTQHGGWALQPTDGAPNLLAGYYLNAITPGVVGATIAGGGSAGYGNLVFDHYGTVSGGSNNQAGDNAGTTDDKPGATVGGGEDNKAGGRHATIPGGWRNLAPGDFSLAVGQHAVASHAGTFVWADASDTVSNFNSQTDNQVRFRARAGMRLDVFSNRWVNIGSANGTSLIDTSTGAYLSVGGAWTNSSDRNLKDGFAPVAPREILRQVIALPITTWHYKTEGPAIRHLGPTAQDFAAAFKLGGTDTAIATVDESGVALAAIQGLYGQMREENAKLHTENALLQARLGAVEAQNARLAARLAALERAVRAQGK